MQTQCLSSTATSIFWTLGWPIDLTGAVHRDWKRGMKALSGCENVAVKTFGMECIFGLDWTVDQIRPWILDVIELFSPERCMFASHMPIAKLACRTTLGSGSSAESAAD
jgi:predicted TIM-barrel fold metal-dependent hydrolase